MYFKRAGLLTTLVVTAVGCGESARDTAHEPADHETDAAHSATASEHDEPMALRPIMQRLGASMAGFQQALWLEDFDAMAARSGEISAHVHISEAELARIEAELGSEMAAFEQADSTVHEAAVRLNAAARARDVDAALRELASVQAGCASCHSAFRERLRTDR